MTKVKEHWNAEVINTIYPQLMNNTFHVKYTKDLLSTFLMHNWGSSDLEWKGLNWTHKPACLWMHVQAIQVPFSVHFSMKIKLNFSTQSPSMLQTPYRPNNTFCRERSGIYMYTEKKWFVSRSGHTHLILESVF